MTMHMKSIEAVRGHFVQKSGDDPLDLLTKQFGEFTSEVVSQLEKGSERLEVIEQQQLELEQTLAQGRSGAVPSRKTSWGEQFIAEKSDDVKALAGVSKGSVELTLKNTITGDALSGGALDVPDRDAPALLPKRRLTIRSLMNVISISSGVVEYPSQTTQPTAAAPVAQGAAKPESALDFELKQTNAKVIAHWLKASAQILDDAPQLRDLIDQELRYGLAIAEELQILAGDGVGANLDGLISNATAFVDPLALSSPTMLDMIGSAILQSALAEFPATGVVVHPADWWRMRLLKDADGKYLLGDPQKAAQPMIFGLPVVPTQAMTVDKFLVADFQSAATLYDRWVPRIETGYVNDDFTRNLVTIRAEERIAMAVKHTAAITYGDFGNQA